MKKTIYLLLITFPFVINGQSSNDSLVIGDYYRITEAYYFRNDSGSYFNQFADTATYMLFLPHSKDSTIISIDQGLEAVYFLGYAAKISNPGFNTTRTDSEFYHWKFLSHVKEGIENAYVLKEYVSGSLEQTGRGIYFISIIFSDSTEYQFYVYEVIPKDNIH